MATFSKAYEGSSCVRTTGIVVPSSIIEDYRYSVDFDIFTTFGDYDDTTTLDERTTTYFTTNSSYTSSPSGAILLNASNLTKYSGQTIYLLFYPDDIHPNLEGEWFTSFQGEIDFITKEVFSGSPLRIGSTEIKTIALGSLECGAIYKGSTRIWHRESAIASARASTSGMNDGQNYYYNYSGSYTFSGALKPYAVSWTTPLNVHTYTPIYVPSTGIFSFSGAAKTSGATVTVTLYAYYAG